MCAYPKQVWRTVSPSIPSSARSIASSAYSRAALRPRLEVRLVDLDDVGPCGLQVAQLVVDRLRVPEREAPPVRVVVVLRLLRHREGAGHGDLDPPLGERTEELGVPNLDRPRAPDRADDPRDRVLVARAVERDPGVVEVDALERRREPVRVALAAHLAVGDHVDPGPLHVGDRKTGRVVLRLLEVRLGHAPELARADARRQAIAEPLAVDQPVGLRIAPDDGRDESSGTHGRPVYFAPAAAVC